jgi:EAL domain-containing protein (putative c-di-GMP-specific phosphodiesterase class I)
LARSVALAHVEQHDDGTSTGVWGPYVLKSAFQPIFALVSEKPVIAAFEGLIRPFRDGVLVPPDLFFPAIDAVDRFHVETLARNLHLLNAGKFLPDNTDLFLNFDPSLFTDRSLADVALRDMRLLMGEADIASERVVCEVTEQRAPSADALRRLVEALRAQGFRIAIDDYGASDSDIARIDEIEPDIVKFDALWTTRLMESDAGVALLSEMVEHFAGRGIVTVFEGIEEDWQLELAEESGAAMVQGFILARPKIAKADFLTLEEDDPALLAANDDPALANEPKQEEAAPSGSRQQQPFGRRSTS